VTMVPAVHAHRGSPEPARGVRENTLDAFFRARLLGADGVELDVRRTADACLAVHHDVELRGLGPVHELRSEQLPESVPLLQQALDACEDLEVDVELKNLPGEPGFDGGESMARAVADLVVGAGRRDTVVVSSFWPGALDAVRQCQPSLRTSLLVASWYDPAACVRTAVEHGCAAVAVHAGLLDQRLMEQAGDAGLSVSVWTLNEPAAIQVAADLGVANVITDDVTVALSALGRV
jgi:glycerophosphoryl diester phosphodiesterase